MARKRKRMAARIDLGSAFKAVLLCAFIGSSAIGYVYQLDRFKKLQNDEDVLKGKVEDVIKEKALLRKELDQMFSLEKVKDWVNELELGLGPPGPEQIVIIPAEDRPTGEVGSGEPQIARGADR